MKAGGKPKTAKPNSAKANKEALALNAFVGKKDAPTDAELASTLGPAKPLWDRVVSAVMTESPELVAEWKCSSPKLGWGLRLQLKKRNIAYLSPCAGSFRVGFVLGEKALSAVREAFGVPPRQRKTERGTRILDLIATAPKYAEGTGVRFEVREEDVDAICKLAKIKITH